MADEKKDVSAWGYSKEEPGGHLFKDGKLPDGYFPNPAMVPGSEAEKRYKADAERDGAKVPWEAETPAPEPKPEPRPDPQAQAAQQAAAAQPAKK